MNYTTAVMLINPNIRAIKTIYEPDVVDGAGRVTKTGQRYTFKTLDTSIKVGDLVVVPTNTRHNFTVVKVEEVDVEVDFEADLQLKWIVDRVDQTNHALVLAEEGKWIEQLKASEKRAKREEIKKKMFDMYQDTGIDKLPIANMMDATTAAAIEHKKAG